VAAILISQGHDPFRATLAASAAGAAAGKRRGRPPKASQLGETGADHSEQMGL
jgi:hypothetical protein